MMHCSCPGQTVATRSHSAKPCTAHAGCHSTEQHSSTACICGRGLSRACQTCAALVNTTSCWALQLLLHLQPVAQDRPHHRQHLRHSAACMPINDSMARHCRTCLQALDPLGKDMVFTSNLVQGTVRIVRLASSDD